MRPEGRKRGERSRLKPPVRRRTRPSARSTRMRCSSRTKATKAPSGLAAGLASSPARGWVSGWRATAPSRGRGREQLEAGRLARAAARRDDEAPAVGQPRRLGVLPVDAEGEDADVPARHRHDADPAVHREGDPGAVGRDRRLPHRLAPERETPLAVPRQAAPVERGRAVPVAHERDRPRDPGRQLRPWRERHPGHDGGRRVTRRAARSHRRI